MEKEQFASGHDGFIHDMAHNFYGDRMATCSADRSIRIWNVDESGQRELVFYIPEAHRAPINRLSWAHPEYGAIIASGSSDQQVKIWNESVNARTNESRWIHKATFTDSNDTITDVTFASQHAGLSVASCSRDGYVRIHEPHDITKLKMWPMQYEFVVDKDGCNSISYNPSPFSALQMAIATPNGAQIWENSERTANRWELVKDMDVHGDVLDVEWAPNLGRPYHLIALACRDGFVRIYQLHPDDILILVAELSNHRSPVWRVSWNVTGTLLASSGDDGGVHLWKCDYAGNWQHVHENYRQPVNEEEKY